MANYILDFINNTESPKADGVTVYKINSETHHRIEVGYLTNGVLKLNPPKKSLAEINHKDINTYYLEFRVYSIEDSVGDSLGLKCSKINKHTIDELLINDTSIGYIDSSKLLDRHDSVKFVFWDQYL